MLIHTALLPFLGGVAGAHHPHDPVDLMAPSPRFGASKIAFASRFPAQNWRAVELIRSTDDAFTWRPVFEGIDNVGEMTDLHLSPLFETDGVGLLTTNGDGAYVTTDSGISWSKTLPGRALQLGAVALAGTAPILLAHEADGALWRSDDLGVSWSPTVVPPLVALDAFDEHVVFIHNKTVYTSTDAGLTWDAGRGVPFIAGDVSVGPEGTTLVGTLGGLYLSEAGGPFELLPLGGTFLTVGVSPSWPADPVLVAAKELQGIWVSEDGGANWSLSPPPVIPSNQSDVHYYDFHFSRDFASDGTVFCNMWEGLVFSQDRGQTWSESDTRPPHIVTAIAVSPDYATDNSLLVGSYDAGAWLSSDRGASWTVVNSGLIRSSTYDVVWGFDAKGPQAIMGMRGHVVWGRPPFDTWEQDPLPHDGYLTRVALSPDHASDQIALAASRIDGVWRTSGGGPWEPVTPPLTAVTSFGWDDNGVVLFGIKSGQLFRSDDDGASFAEVDTLPLEDEPLFVAHSPDGFLVGGGAGLFLSDRDATSFAPVPGMDVPIHQVAGAPDGTWYVVLRGGGVYRSDPGGTFTELAAQLSDGSSLTETGMLHEIQFSPAFETDKTLFASIDERVYRSSDRGDTWTDISPTPVRYEEDTQAITFTGPERTQSGDPAMSVNGQRIVGPGGSASLEFWGVQVGWIGSNGGGQAEVAIDGVVVDTIDTELGGSPSNQTFQLELFRSELLPLGRHTIEVTSLEAEIAVDGFDVYPREASVDTGTGTGTDTGTPDTGTPGTPDTGTPDTTEPPPKDGETDKGACGCASGSSPGAAPLLLLLWLLRPRRR